MRKIFNLLPECFVDTNLIEYLLDAAVNHQHCCSKVVGALNSTFAEGFAVGIIDKDKVELGYIRECDEIAKTAHLTLMKHKTRPQYLITIQPAVDRFVLDCAITQDVDTNAFGIPSDLKGFTKLSKSVTSNTDSRFKHLFAAIKDHAEIVALKQTLTYLNTTQYEADVKELRLLFRQQAAAGATGAAFG